MISSSASTLSLLKTSHEGRVAGAYRSWPVLILAALLTCFWAFSEPAVAQDELGEGKRKPTVSIEDREVLAGASVDVPIEVSGFTGVGAISLIVTYDPEVLQFARGMDTKALISDVPRDNFSANVVKPGELRIAWFDPTGSNAISIEEGTLLEITLGVYAGGQTSVAFAEGSEISNVKAEPIGVTFQDGRVGQK